MNNPFFVKGIWLNNRVALPQQGVGSVIADLLVEGGFRTVYYHVADGHQEFKVQTNWWPPIGYDPKYQPNINPAIVTDLHLHGIKVIGWGMCYGTDPASDGKMAATLATKYGLDGWVFDVEQYLDLGQNATTDVIKLITAFKGLSNLPLGYCSWPQFAGLHPVEVAKVAMQLCDVGIPMAYHMNKELSQAVGSSMRIATAAMAEWRMFTNKPVVLAGRTFQEKGYTTTPEAIAAFDRKARELGAVGSAWWFLDHAQPGTKTGHPTWWKVLKELPQYGEAIEEPRRCPTCNQLWPVG